MKNKWLIVICGPTAVGKTAFSVQLAKHFNSEILSADSRQFYKELKIGSAPPSLKELATVPHYFIADRTLDQDFNAGAFEKLALKKIQELFNKHDILFMVGGSGLYIKAVCDGLDEFPVIDPKVREQLQGDLKEKGIDYLQQQLKEHDSEHYEKIDLQNPQRLIRALEVCISTGKPYSSFRSDESKKRPFHILKIGLEMPREELYERINLRVDKMLEVGLEREAKSLLEFRDKNALQTVGYKEFFEYFDGEIDYDEAVRSIKRNTRRFAKRQMTWFRRDDEIRWFSPKQLEDVRKLIEEAAKNVS